MPSINQLSAQQAVDSSDQVPVFSTNNGQPRRVSLNAVRNYVLQNNGIAQGVFDRLANDAERL